MKTKLLILCMSLFLSLTTSVYANHFFEFSLGVTSPGVGMGFLRGNAVSALRDSLGGNVEWETISYAPAVQLDMLFEFFSYVALETGLAYTHSKVSIFNENGKYDFIRKDITIPLALRLQLETVRVNGYLAAGFKFSIPVTDNFTTLTINDIETKYNDAQSSIYATFALGFEVRLFTANYLGIRAAYDFNVRSPMNVENIFGAGSDKKFYNDNFNISLTYRYAFDSKWRWK